MKTEDVKRCLESMAPASAAEEISRQEPDERLASFGSLPEDRRTVVFGLLDRAYQEELLGRLPPEEGLKLMESLDPDDRAYLLEDLSAPIARRLFQSLSPRERRMTELLLAFPDRSAGRVMTPEFISLEPGMTVGRALDRVRRDGGKAETVYVLPLLGEDLTLLGLVHLKDLVTSPEDARVDELADVDVRSISALEDQETAARVIQATDTLAAPVVDKENRLLGLITVDDAMDIIDREDEEDFARAGGGSEPLARPYLSARVIQLARARFLWLLLLSIAAVLTVNVLNVFQGTLEQIVTIALFIPLLIGIGGNTGTQSATTVVRALSMGEISPADAIRVLSREITVGLLLGTMLSTIGLVPVWLFAGRDMALVVALTLITICTLATLVGAAIPLVLEKIGIDPAVASAPFISTLIDATGLLVYFLVARLVLF
ncbi:MAG TPA: magnesium transporter [Deltaproteobacteria bacterium]|jgi:magnesium transporter|nr:magnesium transporter [Deltaproteobacteria bacterium]